MTLSTSAGTKALTIAVGLVATRDTPQRYVVARRPEGVHLASQWELPGGKVHAGEAPADALVRELDEELGVTVEAPRPLTFSWHAYAERTVLLLFFEARLAPESPDPRPLAASELRLVTADELVALPFPPANAPLVDLLQRLAAARRPEPA